MKRRVEMYRLPDGTWQAELIEHEQITARGEGRNAVAAMRDCGLNEREIRTIAWRYACPA